MLIPVRSTLMSFRGLPSMFRMNFDPRLGFNGSTIGFIAAPKAARNAAGLAPVNTRRLCEKPAGERAKRFAGLRMVPMSECKFKSMSFDDCVTNVGAKRGDCGFIER